MKIIEEILKSRQFEHQPPVLVDIGASGEIHPKWKPIALHSCCIAFDADDREFRIKEEADKNYKRLVKINRIVSTKTESQAPFFLTRSPFCSSLLEPDRENLSPWLFKSLFDVVKISSLPSVTLEETLKTLDISYIDWLKTDTQGTDLRIYQSLPGEIRKNILAAEFEPGIMDAYKGEDKLYAVMNEMHREGYWLSSMQVKGTQRLNEKFARQIGDYLSGKIIRTSPCWAELTYFRNPTELSLRNVLLNIVFALLEKQYGYALELCDIGIDRSDEPLLVTAREAILQKILKEKRKLPLIYLKRKFNKLFSGIDT